jgi:hypothetical protein
MNKLLALLVLFASFFIFGAMAQQAQGDRIYVAAYEMYDKADPAKAAPKKSTSAGTAATGAKSTVMQSDKKLVPAVQTGGNTALKGSTTQTGPANAAGGKSGIIGPIDNKAIPAK